MFTTHTCAQRARMRARNVCACVHASDSLMFTTHACTVCTRKVHALKFSCDLSLSKNLICFPYKSTFFNSVGSLSLTRQSKSYSVFNSSLDYQKIAPVYQTKKTALTLFFIKMVKQCNTMDIQCNVAKTYRGLHKVSIKSCQRTAEPKKKSHFF